MILRRHQGWPAERLSTVERGWEGRTVVCIATGPSLTPEQIVQVRAAGVPTIVVNDAYQMAPFADLAYFADLKWWNWHKAKPEWKAFAGERCSIFVGGNVATAAPSDPQVHLLRSASEPGLSTKPGEICTGSNSGYQAINIATLAGAKRIVLVGYDCQARDGRHHYFGDHPDKSFAPYEAIRARFGDLVVPTSKLGVEILNATPGSRIGCFPMVTLAESLEPLTRPAVV